jgi:hypothetical protein
VDAGLGCKLVGNHILHDFILVNTGADPYTDRLRILIVFIILL